MKQVLWTIQHEAAWEVFEKTGVLVANEGYLFCQDDLRFAYDWMSQQMAQRIGAPPKGVRYPVWATYQWEGKRKREDLRRAGYAERGTPMVQITFEAEENEFLLSDFDLWIPVLAMDYVATNETDWNAFHDQIGRRTQKDVEPSWQRIFDLTLYDPDWITRPPEKKTIQATLWQIKMEQVKNVKHFIAK